MGDYSKRIWNFIKKDSWRIRREFDGDSQGILRGYEGELDKDWMKIWRKIKAYSKRNSKRNRRGTK